MIESLQDALLDTLKIIPYLFVTFIIMELIEHKLNKKNQKLLMDNQKYGPIVGGLLGSLPQCGFSTMASNLFSNKVITIGTVVAVFLATSDEMLPIMLSENISFLTIIKIIGFKVLIGIIVGLIVDLLYKRKVNNETIGIHEMCESSSCGCEEKGIIISSLIHTLKIGVFILFANVIINLAIFKIGEENLSSILLNKNIITYFIASIIGLIPNCASSVIITELYLNELITTGVLLSGLLTGSGLGILLLFKENKNLKENLVVLSIIYFVGVTVGIIVDLVI